MSMTKRPNKRKRMNQKQVEAKQSEKQQPTSCLHDKVVFKKTI